MLELISDVQIPTPGHYAVRLAQHFEHRVSVHREDEMLRIHFADATCEMRPGEAMLHIHIQSRSHRALSRCREVVARNLKQVAGHESFAIAWTGNVTELPIPVEDFDAPAIESFTLA